MNSYQPIIGLEIHVELYTKTKMFCRCSAMYFGEDPNTHTCPTCLGLPGALPYPNQKAIDYCVMIALALNCKISHFSYFERKNYFYPDLAKGYQLTQYKDPFGYDGYLDIKIKDKVKRIKVRRVHMEEDTGKIVHTIVNGEKVSLIDFNRSGVPLVEIVTEPDIESGEEAKIFLTELQKIIRYQGVSEADMEKGDMRLEPNISLKKAGEKSLPNYKVEVKNINSFRFVEKAINYEITRQTKLLEKGETPLQETRGWDEIRSSTLSQRVKEEAHDYRYFPEPDIPPVKLTENHINKIKEDLVELPYEKIERFIKDYLLSYYDAEILTREKETADYFEQAVKEGKISEVSPKQIANEIINKKIDIKEVLPKQIIVAIVSAKKTVQIDEKELEEVIKKVLSENPKAVEDYKNGKIQVIGFLIGTINKKLEGKKIDNQLIRKNLENHLK